MPTSITVNGASIYKPGVYGKIDASALAGSNASVGNVAVVGDFPRLEQNTPTRFNSSPALFDYAGVDPSLQLLAKLIFGPANDDRVTGAASCTVVNAREGTAAGLTLLDDAGGDSIDLTSKLFGVIGNRILVKIENLVAASEAVTITVTGDGKQEVFADIDAGDLFTVTSGAGYDNAYASVATPATGLALKWSMDALTDGVDGTTPVDILAGVAVGATVDGVVEATQNDPSTGALSLTVTGTNKATGLPDSEVLPLVHTSTESTTKEWTGPVTVSLVSDNAGDTGLSVLVEASPLDTAPGSYDSLASLVSAIDQNPGFTATAVSPRLAGIPADELDYLVSTAISAASATLRADTYHIVQTLGASDLVTAARASGGTKPPKEVGASPIDSTEALLSGGTQGAGIAASDWTDALQSIETEDVQIVVVMDDDITTMQALSQHCINAALYGQERNGWVGCPGDQTLATVFSTYTSKINSRHVALAAQKVKVTRPSGAQEFVEPMWLAVILAGMQAGTPIATPLTWKRPNVLDVSQDWHPIRDLNEAISKGICALDYDNLGWRVARSVTTWLSDDNPVYSEVSANESVNTSIRDLRGALQVYIGDPVNATTSAAFFRSVVQGRLRRQVTAGIIKDWRNVVVTDLGDRFQVSYEAAPVEPLNFFDVTLYAVRIPTAA